MTLEQVRAGGGGGWGATEQCEERVSPTEGTASAKALRQKCLGMFEDQ